MKSELHSERRGTPRSGRQARKLCGWGWIAAPTGGIENILELRALRVITLPAGAHAPDAIRFHFADAAWGWALGAALSLVWANDPGVRRTGWFVVGAIFVVGTEIAQLAGLMPGTFDPIDIIVSIFAYAAAWRLVSRAVLRLEVPSHV